MAQAVAVWQFPQSLKPDGMAGPRTLPRMFESGLAEKKSREAVVKTTEGVQQRLEGPQDRRGARRQALRGRQGPARGGGRQAGAQARGQGPGEDRRPVRAQVLDDLLRRRLVLRPRHRRRRVHETLQAPSTTRPATPSRATRWRACSRPRATRPSRSAPRWSCTSTSRRARTPTRCPRASSSPPPSQQFDSVYGPGKAQHEKAEREARHDRRAASGQAGRGRQPDRGEQGALPAAGGRVPRLPRPADRERRVRHRALLRGELGRGASLKSPAARVNRRSQARVGRALSRVRACH